MTSVWSRWARVGAAVLAVVALAGCEEKKPPPVYRVTFTATTDGKPLSGVQIVADGEDLGKTDEEGELRVDLQGREGKAVAVHAQCPEGYRPPEQLPLLTLRKFQGLDPEAAERGLEMSIECPPAQRLAVVAIRAVGDDEGVEGLPVMMRGREIARTDRSGAAHVMMELSPTASFRLELDTSEHERLQPKNPGETYTLNDADEIFFLDQSFKVKKRRRRWRPRRKKPDPGPQLPVRLN